MRREFRVPSTAVAGTSTGAQGLAFCDDHDVIGADFLVVGVPPRRGGLGPRPAVDGDARRRRPAGRLRRGRRAGRTAPARPGGVGLGDLGRPDGFVERQVAGWRKRWDLVDTGGADGDGARSASAWRRRCRSVARGRPCCTTTTRSTTASSTRPTRPCAEHVRLGHGDARRSARRPRHAAQLLARSRPTSTATAPLARPRPGAHGSATRAEVVERYAERTGRRRRAIVPWYEAFATLEDVRRARAAVPALRARREHRPADGRAGQARRPAQRARPRHCSTGCSCRVRRLRRRASVTR